MRKRQQSFKAVSKRLGLNIRELRQRKGWTLEDCEERGGMNWRQLQAIESGRNVTLKTLMNVASLFGVSLADLFQGM